MTYDSKDSASIYLPFVDMVNTLYKSYNHTERERLYHQKLGLETRIIFP